MNIVKTLFRAIQGKLTNYMQAQYTMLGNGTMLTQSGNAEDYVNDMQRSANVYVVTDKFLSLSSNVTFRHVDSEGKDIENSGVMHLINNPNPFQSREEYEDQVSAMLALTGNAYIYAPTLDSGNNAGKRTEMYCLPSPFVVINSGGWRQPVESYSLQLGRTDIKLDPKDVIHIKKLPIDISSGAFGLYGISPFAAGSGIVAKAKSNMNIAVKLNTAGMPLGLLSHHPSYRDGQTGEPAALDAEQIEMVRDNFNKSFGGNNSRSKIMMQSIAMDYQRMGLDFKEMGISEDYWDGIRQVGSLLSIPSVLLNDPKTSAFNNVSEATKWVYTQSVIPHKKRIANEYQKALAEAYNKGSKIVIDTSDVLELQENLKEKAETYNRPGIPVNVFLEKMGEDPIKELDGVLIGSLANFTTIDEIKNAGAMPEEDIPKEEEVEKYFKGLNHE